MVKPNINSIEIHPQLMNNGHPVDDDLVGAGSLWPSLITNGIICNESGHLRKTKKTL